MEPVVKSKLATSLLSDDLDRVELAVRAIPAAHRDQHIAWVYQKLKDTTDADVQLAAMTALFVLRPVDIEIRLIELAQLPRFAIRRRAILYLGELRSKLAIPIISASMSDRLPEIRMEAREAYAKITAL